MERKRNSWTPVFFRRAAWLCAVGLWGFMQTLDALEVERLRTEAVKNPVGIDVEKPMFSWRMDAGDERGVKQTAYEIAVFSDAACTEQVWTSGRVKSDRQIDVAYEGDKLQPSTRYYWTVTVWDNKGGESTSTEEAYFETGLMGGGWNGARCGGQGLRRRLSLPRKECSGGSPGRGERRAPGRKRGESGKAACFCAASDI